MNKATLKKLQQNPHYKIAARQRVVSDSDEEQEHLVGFGSPKFHNQSVERTFKRVTPTQTSSK